MRVALLGATGFVGGHLASGLRARGHAVRPVVRNVGYAREHPEARMADVCDVQSLRSAIDGCDSVVHAALGPPETIVGSAAPVYAAAEGAGVKRFVYISSGSVHGQSPRPGTDERTPLSLQQPFEYNVAKIRAERILRRLRRRGTVELVILRPGIVLGPGSRWVYDFADALLEGTAYLVDGARGICNSIDVDNVAHAVHLALTADGVDGEAFVVGDEETVTWRDLYRPIADALGADLDAVPSVPAPDLRLTFRERYVEPARTSPLGQILLARVPAPLKRALKGAYRGRHVVSRAPRPERSAPEAGPAAERPLPAATREMALLHTCRWRLPHDKARRMLGYHAPVTFEEGCRRSVAWLLARRQAIPAASCTNR